MTSQPSKVTQDHARLRALLDSAVDGIITINELGTIDAINPAAEKLFGYSASEVVGRNVKMLMPAPFSDEHDQYISNYRQTGEKKIIGIGREVDGQRKDGTVFPVYLSVSEVYIDGNRSFTGILHDLSALRAAETEATQFGRIVDNSLNEIYVFDAKSLKFLMVNRGALQNIGYSNEEIEDLTPADLKPEYSLQEFRNLLKTLESGQETSIQFEAVHRRKDGSEYPVIVRIQPTRLNSRNAFVATILDITEQKRAENELRRRSVQVRSLVEHLPAAAAYVDIVTGAVHFNNMIERITGYSAEELSSLEKCNEKLFAADATAMREATRALDHVNDANEIRLRLNVQRADGQARVAEFHGYRYDNHEVWLLLDITERDRHDTELRIRNQALQSATEGILIADATRRGRPITFVNPAFEEMSGIPSAKAIGQPFELLCGDADDDSVAQLKNALSAGTDAKLTINCGRPDGTKYWNEMSIALVRSAEEQVTHLVAVMEDVTEQRESQEQRLQSERLAAIGQMVTGLAHESRNALQRAQACLDMLALDLEEQPEQLDLTSKIQRALTDLHRYYEEVRNYAAPLNLEKRNIELSTIWRATWNDLESIRMGRDFQLVENLPADGTECHVDEHRIQQVFRNIMENSIAACPDPGSLTITCFKDCTPDADLLKVVFQDNGPGLTAETAANVFQPFFTTKQKGTGLGMAIASRIVEAHGGTFEVGPPENCGAQFILNLPCGPRS